MPGVSEKFKSLLGKDGEFQLDLQGRGGGGWDGIQTVCFDLPEHTWLFTLVCGNSEVFMGWDFHFHFETVLEISLTTLCVQA